MLGCKSFPLTVLFALKHLYDALYFRYLRNGNGGDLRFGKKNVA